MLNNKILVLIDHRAGTNNQSIALAKEIGLEYEILKIKHGILSKLPNNFLTKSLFRLSIKSKKDLLNKIKKDGYPRIIISGGRRLAIISQIIKKKSNSKSRIIQIMKPQLPLNNFDIVILPYHDNLRNRKNKKIIFSIGSLNSINRQSLAKEKERFANIFGKIKKNKIGLLIGGKSRNYKFNKQEAIILAEKLAKIAKKENAKILVVNSRRTETKINNIFKNLNCDHQFFDWKDYKNENTNPYKAILAYSDKLIVSADSISMISECCSTEKPTYVFNCDQLPSKKHQRFLQYMLRNRFIKKLNINKNLLRTFEVNKLQETKRIASIIKSNYLGKIL